MRHFLSFGRFRFEPSTARLWQDSHEIKLTRKAAAVLGLLVARAGQPVGKQELFESVWGNVVVSDDALVTCIQELRKALGDDARRAHYIETRHRRGYLFIAEVSLEVPYGAGRRPPNRTNIFCAVAKACTACSSPIWMTVGRCLNVRLRWMRAMHPPGPALRLCTHFCSNGGVRATKICNWPIGRVTRRWNWRRTWLTHTSREAMR
jgi:DNA-binding winged helix-turn-helix (wHTH) protein